MSNTNIDIKRLYEIDWSSYHHAHGRADDIPGYLEELFSNDQGRVSDAISRLYSCLCSQPIGGDSALIPALPFLVQALNEISDAGNLEELLDLLVDISFETRPPDPYYSIRVLDLSWTRLYKTPNELATLKKPANIYVQEIRQQLLANRKNFTVFLGHQKHEIFSLAKLMVANFSETPVETVEELLIAISHEKNAARRDILYSGFSKLEFENKLVYLKQAFHEETDKFVKGKIAGQIAYEMKTNSPADIVEILSELVLDMTDSDMFERGDEGLFINIGIPLALARPDKYEKILERYINYMRHLPALAIGKYFLAFALCWNGKPDFDNLNQLQLNAIETVYQKSWQGKFAYPAHIDFDYFYLPINKEEMESFLHKHKA
jgi:hypothetical protein